MIQPPLAGGLMYYKTNEKNRKHNFAANKELHSTALGQLEKKSVAVPISRGPTLLSKPEYITFKQRNYLPQQSQRQQQLP